MIDTSNKYPMSSLDIVKKLSKYLTYYFTKNRKEVCFDLSGPNLPLRHYPTRYQKTLIDYQQDVSKPLKHYFSSLDLRKRLTTFNQKTKNEERHKEILKKIEEYIISINAERINHQTLNETRRAPWDSTWWKTHCSTFQGTQFLAKYGGFRGALLPTNRDSASFKSKMKKKSMKNKKNKARYNGGAEPVLKMCPHTYASRGEAERIINHAARLLLVTENFDSEAYEFSAPGMKSKYVYKGVTRKISEKMKTTHRPQKDSIMINKADREHTYESNTDSITRTNPFKIKKLIYPKDIETPEDFPKHPYEIRTSDDSVPVATNIHDHHHSKKNHFSIGRDGKWKCRHLFPNCACGKSISTEIDYTKENKNMKTNSLLAHKEKKNSNDEIMKDSSEPPIKADLTAVPIENENVEKLNKQNENDGPVIVEASHESSVRGWLYSQVSIESFDDVPEQRNDNCHEKTTTKNAKQVFEVKVITGDRIGASTNAIVWLHMTGDRGSLKNSVELKKSSTHRRPFLRGNTDVFNLTRSENIGNLQSIQIGHDSDQPGSDWFLDSVAVRDCNNQVSYFFPCYKWLSVRSEDKQTRVNIRSQPIMHDAHILKPPISHADVGIQSGDISEYNDSNFCFGAPKNSDCHDHQKKKKDDSLSDLAVEFSELSFSESSTSSWMSMRKNDRYRQSDIFDFHYPQLEDVAEEAIVSVKENMPDEQFGFNFKNEVDTKTYISLSDDAEDSYSPNPISFCDEDTS